MQTIGVLGGMSWESSPDWYRIADEIACARATGKPVEFTDAM